MSSKRIALTHRLTWQFERPVQLSTHWLRLCPAPHTKAEVEAYSLRVQPEAHFINWLRDPYENELARLDLPEPVTRLQLEVDLVATLTAADPFDFLLEPGCIDYPFDYPEQLRKELAPYLRQPALGKQTQLWLDRLERWPGYIMEQLSTTNRQVQGGVQRLFSSAAGHVDLENILERGSATPWQLAWLLTVSLRHLGLAARFTSGYRVFLSEDHSRLPDNAALHAWSEVFLPGAGWVGLDPASAIFTHEGYIPLASTPEPLRALPWAGYCEARSEENNESLQVRRLEGGMPQWPYGAGRWDEIVAAAEQVDAALGQQGMALTVGSTVAFVSVANTQLPEWSGTALGWHKRSVAEQLLTALRQRLCPGGLFQAAQGEWFSGEPLPRWRLGCHFRSDGRPVWSDTALNNWQEGERRLGHDDLHQFATTLCRALNLDEKWLLAAHEDPLHQLWLNGSAGVMPQAKSLRDPEQRRALAEQLSQPVGHPSGYVLPLHWDSVAQRWISGRWRFRRGALYLRPGSSPIGLRLPLESLPVGDEIIPPDPERCQFDERELLPERVGELSARLTSFGPPHTFEAAADGAAVAGRAPRTALVIELRDRSLYAFLPPLTHVERYLDLVDAIESSARHCELPVRMEGYEPPHDRRLPRIMVEPEAGVLKVTLSAARNWREQSEQLEILYAEAESLGLRAERYDASGHHLPPGGESGFILGGDEPARSPFLQRPELLRALVSCWQRHPCLSYFFAGGDVGPSRPAPRPDEGRDDALYELGIALDRIPAGHSDSPWMPDRLLRHLLADASGNMSRAELGIEQLYAPDRPGQRLGQVAVRSLDAAPHARLAAVQGLLLRALLAHFAQQPRSLPLKHWGEELHDGFMLPDLLWEDLNELLAELPGRGLPLQAAWFEPFLEQRFPVLGRVQIGDIQIELRRAHEPWPLLSEEAGPGGAMTRYIDSSCERVQVKVTGMTPSRHQLVCNGRRVPLQPTARRGEYVAGVRYKVWSPAATLHPTLPPVSELLFDLLDGWDGTLIGGCTLIPTQPSITGGPVALVAPPPTPHLQPSPSLPSPFQPPAWGGGGQFIARPQPPAAPPFSAEKGDLSRPYLLDLVVL
ncbi:MAG: transglutaminase family protein [Pseudomonadota bacterium]